MSFGFGILTLLKHGVIFSVLYISLHRYDGGFFYPGSPEGNYDWTGSGAGEGFNINIPWQYVSIS